MRNEAEFSIKFKQWIEINPQKKTCVYELKITHSESFQLSQWVKKHPHQYINLLKSKYENVYHKISDQSSGQKPFDSFCVSNAEAYLVIFFSKYNEFCMYPIDYIKNIMKTSKSVRFDVSPVIYRYKLSKKEKKSLSFNLL